MTLCAQAERQMVPVSHSWVPFVKNLKFGFGFDAVNITRCFDI